MFSPFPSPFHHCNCRQEIGCGLTGSTCDSLRRGRFRRGDSAQVESQGTEEVARGARAHGAPGPHGLAGTHRRAGEASARPGLQLALAPLALAVEELLCDFALVAAGHRPVGAQFPLAPRAALAVSGPASREVAQVVVIGAVIELLLGAHLARQRLRHARGVGKGLVHRAPLAAAGARAPLEAPPRPALRLAPPEGAGSRVTSQSWACVLREVSGFPAWACVPPSERVTWQHPILHLLYVGQKW